MRWVFFSLLILNVVYGIWRLALGAAPAPEVVSRAMETAPQTLTLLSEVPEDQRPELLRAYQETVSSLYEDDVKAE